MVFKLSKVLIPAWVFSITLSWAGPLENNLNIREKLQYDLGIVTAASTLLSSPLTHESPTVVRHPHYRNLDPLTKAWAAAPRFYEAQAIYSNLSTRLQTLLSSMYDQTYRAKLVDKCPQLELEEPYLCGYNLEICEQKIVERVSAFRPLSDLLIEAKTELSARLAEKEDLALDKERAMMEATLQALRLEVSDRKSDLLDYEQRLISRKKEYQDEEARIIKAQNRYQEVFNEQYKRIVTDLNAQTSLPHWPKEGEDLIEISCPPAIAGELSSGFAQSLKALIARIKVESRSPLEFKISVTDHERNFNGTKHIVTLNLSIGAIASTQHHVETIKNLALDSNGVIKFDHDGKVYEPVHRLTSVIQQAIIKNLTNQILETLQTQEKLSRCAVDRADRAAREDTKTHSCPDLITFTDAMP